MKMIRWGIIGCGDVTEIKSGPAFQKARGSELVAVMRRDLQKAADFARRHGVPRWYDHGDTLIADPLVDAVYVATPPEFHEHYALKVCAANKPCYVEKPMARNAPEAQRMVEAFAARQLPLFVAYYRRCLPRFIKAKQIIDSGALGVLKSVSYHFADGSMRQRASQTPWRLQAKVAGGGLFLDLGSHALDVLDFLVGPLLNVRGTAMNVGRQYDVEDQVQMTFSTAANAIGSASWSFIEDQKQDDFQITGDLGELRLSCFANIRLTHIHANRQEEIFDLSDPPHVHQPLVQSVMDELLDESGKLQSSSTGKSALRTQVIMDQVLESYYGGREDGFWDRSWPVEV